MQQRFFSTFWDWAKRVAHPNRLAERGRFVGEWIAAHTRLVTLALGALIVGALVSAAVRPAVMSASEVNVLANGSFEEGFHSVPGCGLVGRQWTCFTNGGAANYGFYDDLWSPVVADGTHSQLIEINTHGITAPDADRYAGIAQTVRVRPNATYTFKMRGMVRTTHLDGDPWRYRVEVGWLPVANGDWRNVTNWADAGWDTYFERTKPGHMDQFMTTLRPNSEVITVFVRVWKKWGVPNEEIDVNLDAIGLFGPSPAPVHGPVGPPVHPGPGVGGPVAPPVVSPPGYTPAQPPAQHHQPETCSGQDLVYNGNFEGGFVPVGNGEVGRGWSAFTNGGAIHAGFRAEDWGAVIADGRFGQAIELSSRSLYPTDADRYAGIAQRIGGLQPGRTYELSLRGLVRGTDGNHDPYRFEAQWGFTEGYQDDWRHVKNWERLDFGSIQSLTEPVSVSSVRVRFTAPASSVVLFIRGWKKWAVTNEEMIVNIDAISLLPCGGVGGPAHGPGYGSGQPPVIPGPVVPVKPDTPHQTGCTITYTVRAGDTLAAIAQRLGVNITELTRLNRLPNPNLIRVGQVLDVPCGTIPPHSAVPPIATVPPSGGPGVGPRPPEAGKPEQPGAGARTYTVRAGDTLSGIAVRFGVSQQQLANVNGIRNPNHIYVGQVLRIP